VDCHACYLLHAGFLLDSFFVPEDESEMFLRNVSWFSTNYTALYSRKILNFHLTLCSIGNEKYCDWIFIIKCPLNIKTTWQHSLVRKSVISIKNSSPVNMSWTLSFRENILGVRLQFANKPGYGKSGVKNFPLTGPYISQYAENKYKNIVCREIASHLPPFTFW
jgi:hypothetical protein